MLDFIVLETIYFIFIKENKLSVQPCNSQVILILTPKQFSFKEAHKTTIMKSRLFPSVNCKIFPSETRRNYNRAVKGGELC